MHIHPSSPEASLFLEPEESAAIKIQAGFRGYRVRKYLHHQKNRKPKINGYTISRSSQHNTRMLDNTQKNENSQNTSVVNANSIASNDEAELQKCATKIQAGVRGFLVRKKQKLEADAATKIQAGFRGFKARKDVEKLKQK